VSRKQKSQGAAAPASSAKQQLLRQAEAVAMSSFGDSAGRGLDAVFGRRSSSLISIPVADIVPNPVQPRREFNLEELERLAQSIIAEGLLQPIIVRETARGYELIAGERRWRAYCALCGQIPDGWPPGFRRLHESFARLLEQLGRSPQEFSRIAAIVRSASSPSQVVAENLIRTDLNLYEHTEAVLLHLRQALRGDKQFQEFAAAARQAALQHRGGQSFAGDPFEDELRLLDAIFRAGDQSNRKVTLPESLVLKVSNELRRVAGLTVKSFVVKRLPVRRLEPELLDLVRSGRMDFSVVREIRRLPQPVWKEHLNEFLSLTSREAAVKVRQLLKSSRQAKVHKPGERWPELKALYEKANRLDAGSWPPKLAERLNRINQEAARLLVELQELENATEQVR